ncbi:MAG: 2-amino-4-hydroxy-6-hydroxymethyldihydropteridine diphosphokinase [Caldilineaceae bacterium]
MPEYLVLLGSNIDANTNIRGAIEMLLESPNLDVRSVSRIYESPAVVAPGKIDRERTPYHNAAVLISTDLDWNGLHGELRHIEEMRGRVRDEDKYADRTIDLDIVGVACVSGTCEIDPIVREQGFAALPVADIADSWQVEPDGPTLGDLAREHQRQHTPVRRIG